MSTATQEPTPQLQPGEGIEKLAFTFCKCATVALICGRFALPIAATLSAILYLSAHQKGFRETRCILGPPVRVAAFWLLVVAGWVWWTYFKG